MANSKRVFWGAVLDRIIKAGLLGVTLAAIVGTVLRYAVEYHMLEVR